MWRAPRGRTFVWGETAVSRGSPPHTPPSSSGEREAKHSKTFSWALEEPDSLAPNKAGSRPFCFPLWKRPNTDPMLCLEEGGWASPHSFEYKPICIGGQTPLCWWKKGRGMLPLINAEPDISRTSSRSTKVNRIWSFSSRQNEIARPGVSVWFWFGEVGQQFAGSWSSALWLFTVHNFPWQH